MQVIIPRTNLSALPTVAAAFETQLMDALDAYGHSTWTVGNEDWLAAADAVLGRFEDRLFLAWHVVVDCESGGFTDTLESGIVEVTKGSKPPQGILSSWLDRCWEIYALDQAPRGRDCRWHRHCQIDQEGSLRAISEFDDHIQLLWEGGVNNVTIEWEDEHQEDFDPVAMGWVGCDGRP